jgi:hypothetical protein
VGDSQADQPDQGRGTDLEQGGRTRSSGSIIWSTPTSSCVTWAGFVKDAVGVKVVVGDPDAVRALTTRC